MYGSSPSDPGSGLASKVVLISDLSTDVSESFPTVDGSASGAEPLVASRSIALLPSPPYAQSTVTTTDLAISSEGSLKMLIDSKLDVTHSEMAVANATSATATTTPSGNVPSIETGSIPAPGNQAPTLCSDSWVDLVKGSAKKLSKKSPGYPLPSGELCVKIPNVVIERNRKSWDLFIIGQFYSDPASQGTLHNIVNGIWSRQYRDISVSKMEGNAFLFRIPNSYTRSRVLNQIMCQIEGQTMFVAKWEPGLVPVKPELSSSPIWLELRNVPFQFFHEKGLSALLAGWGIRSFFTHPLPIRRTMKLLKSSPSSIQGNLCQRLSMFNSNPARLPMFWFRTPGCHQCTLILRR